MAGLVVVDTDLLIDFLRGKGTGIALVRTLLVEQRFRVATRNRRHFDRIPGLRLTDLDPESPGRRTGRSLADELDEVAQRGATLPVLDERSEDDILGYDATGLPRQDDGVGH